MLPPLPVLPEALRALPVFAKRDEPLGLAAAAASNLNEAAAASASARLTLEQHSVNSSESPVYGRGEPVALRSQPLSLPVRAPPAPPAAAESSGGGPSRRAPPAPPSVLAAAPPHLQGVLREYLSECERREEAENKRVF